MPRAPQGGPLLSLMGAGQQLFNMAHAAVAAGQPPLEPGEGSTAALLLQALQAPATEALLALAAEFLARQPRATNQEGSEASVCAAECARACTRGRGGALFVVWCRCVCGGGGIRPPPAP